MYLQYSNNNINQCQCDDDILNLYFDKEIPQILDVFVVRETCLYLYRLYSAWWKVLVESKNNMVTLLRIKF